MEKLLKDIKSCQWCSSTLPHVPRPVLQVSSNSKILIIGQAPGLAVHKSGVPWDDKSGENLRAWLNVNKDQFYNTENFGIVPMGFCYPGKGKSGDLPPRIECAPKWHPMLMEQLNQVQLTLLIGQYAQRYYLSQKTKENLTKTVKNFQEYLPKYFVLPHPSPRNNIWQAKNPWFKQELLPMLQQQVKDILS